MRYRIADGYYLYRDKLRFSAQPETVALGKPDLPSGKIKQDEFFGKVETYRGEVAIRVPFTAPQGTGDFTLKAQSQGCADAGLCYTPQQQTARLQLVALSEQGASPKTGVLSKLRQMARAEEAEPDFLPPDQAFKVTLTAREGNTVVARFAPAEGYYLYRDKISFSIPKDAGIAITKVELPPGEKKSDPNFGETVVFHAPFEAVCAPRTRRASRAPAPEGSAAQPPSTREIQAAQKCGLIRRISTGRIRSRSGCWSRTKPDRGRNAGKARCRSGSAPPSGESGAYDHAAG